MEKHEKEYIKMAMLKHEEDFREQVNELHRLYQIQKILMQDIAKQSVEDRYHEPVDRPKGRSCSDLDRLVIEDDDFDNLELTLGSKSYSRRKFSSGLSDCWSGFSSSSGSNHVKSNGSSTRDGSKWGVDQMSSNQDKLSSPPWLFHALSLNMT